MDKKDITENNEESKNKNFEISEIKNLIYCIRGKQVMLDSDVANIYQCETKYVNRVVRRNIVRFPEEFYFQLTETEFENLRCQFVTSSFNEKNHGGRRYFPYAFTEQGIAMLSALLRSDVAISVSINIMKAFVEMRRFVLTNRQVFERLNTVEYKLLEHEGKFEEVFNALQKKEESEFKQKIFFKGQIYDAYKLIVDIIKSANTKILIIDNYIDESVLEILTKKNERVEVIIITSQNCNINKLDINKFNQQYPRLKICKTKDFHDRFIIIDDKKLYHCGASLKDLGKRCFAISEIIDKEYIEKFNKLTKCLQ